MLSMFFLVVLTAVTLGIVAGTVLITQTVANWCTARLKTAPKPSVWIAVGIWAVAAGALLSYESWRGWSIGSYLQEFNALSYQADQDAQRVATEQGEVVSRGPIFQAEFAARMNKAWQLPHPAAATPFVERLILPIWIACGILIAGYYFAVYRKTANWLTAFAAAPVVGGDWSGNGCCIDRSLLWVGRNCVS